MKITKDHIHTVISMKTYLYCVSNSSTKTGFLVSNKDDNWIKSRYSVWLRHTFYIILVQNKFFCGSDDDDKTMGGEG